MAMYMCGHAVGYYAVVVGLLITTLTPPLAAGIPWPVCSSSSAGNYTANSTYGGNLRLVAAALPSDVSTSPTLFAVATTGTAPDIVYAIGQCIGDLQSAAAACRDCIAASFEQAQKMCPHNKGAAIFDHDNDTCQIGFSNQDFLVSHANSQDQEVMVYNAENITSDIASRFNAFTYTLLNSMAEYVSTTNSTNKYVTASIAIDAATYPYIYGMASCTPDLVPWQCRGCLSAAISDMISGDELTVYTKGARIRGLRCTAQYELYRFYNSSTMLQLSAAVPPPPPPPPPPAIHHQDGLFHGVYSFFV
jgi:hypothetical protein